MWYEFELYKENGSDVEPVDDVLILAGSIPEAWFKAGERAYKYGYCDFRLVEEETGEND